MVQLVGVVLTGSSILARLLKETSLEKMEKPFCVIPLQPNENTGSELEKLRSTYIANCVFDSFLSYAAIMLNIVTIHAIRKVSSLPKTLRTFSPRFMAQARSARAINRRGKNEDP